VEAQILRTDPTNRSVWWAVRYVLQVRTNVVIIIASALGYFYFTGLRSFAILFATSHYGISKPTATALILVVGAGAVAGVLSGGRVADRMLARGRIRARVLVPTVCILAISPLLAPAFLVTSIAVALPLLTVGAFLLGAPNPPLDAARLDIMHPRLWGRAEGVRTVLRGLADAGAPLIFGYVSQYVFGGPGSANANGAARGNGDGLAYTFLVMLIPLIIAGLLALFSLRTYPRDVATATASIRAISKTAEEDHGQQPGSAGQQEQSGAQGQQRKAGSAAPADPRHPRLSRCGALHIDMRQNPRWSRFQQAAAGKP